MTAGVRSLLRLARGHHGAIAATVALTLLSSGLALAQPLVVKTMIEDAGRGGVAWAPAAALVGLFAAAALTQAGVRYLVARTGERVVRGVRHALADRLLRLSAPAYDRLRSGDLISRTGTDTVTLRHLVGNACTDAVTGCLGLTAAVALMLWLDWVLFTAVALLVAVAAAALAFALRRMRAASLDAQRAVGAMAADLERALSALRTVRAARAEPREIRRVTGHADGAYDASLRMARYDALAAPATELAVTGSFLTVLLVGGLRVANGTTSVAELVAFLLYLLYLTAPLGALFEAFSTLQQGSGAVHRIDEALRLPREEASGSAPVPAARPDVPLLELRDVWFGYQPRRPVLRGVSFRVPERGHVALVGRSGAGKSTTFALIERFHDPDGGRILFRGADVRSLDRAGYRARVGLVEQDCPVLHGTLRDNLLYAAPDADDADLREVLALTNLAGLVARLPGGLDSPVGEHGCRLSGGERQRVALARALLARPDLLLLDEPTSHLDAANERALRHAIDRAAAHCALLVIAHRFTTIRAAAHILVLDEGGIVAAGTHDHLLATSDHYRALADGWLADTPPAHGNALRSTDRRNTAVSDGRGAAGGPPCPWSPPP
ncbi:ABC transporter ATP-binding protein [Actinomadura kijaniata]|uniref:ABC-type multidrug transport system fused ATPase/permease subunit n=1 Tax=Actinomadura namibiensis TaxID=182080 RepID=A0A7W3LN35_ACTNM|nr:ABC transporter ATP-binding protein [Actinomadura namibiensis]MBA8951156.1 ABC-type multidrug transport system fused ATPase/permease subunit [Actinomadura namibiensis]